MALSDVDEFFVEIPDRLSDETLVETEEMFAALKCRQCHQVSEDAAAGSLYDLAPDLSMARRRLRPRWIEKWLVDPQTLEEGTRMPTYFPLEDDEDSESASSPLPNILGGDPHKQIRALRDYLMTLTID